MKTVDTEVITKIQKLLNIADTSRNSSLEEASSALEMAHRFLRKHHLSMSQVLELDVEKNSNTDFIELKEVDAVTYAANILPKWLDTIIRAVNRITQTKTLVKRTPRGESIYGNLTIVFVGDNFDVMSAIELFEFLKTTVSRLSTDHAHQYGGKFKYWRSFADGCAQKLLDRADELEQKLDDDINRHSLFNKDKFSIDDRELDEDDDYEIYDEEIEEQLENENFSIELYNKYKETKIEKIKDYIEQLEVENEKSSSKSARLEIDSFKQGQKAGEKIPLKVSSKLNKAKRR